MKYVYFLESLASARMRYVGVSNDLNSSLIEHNAGKCAETRDFTPWKIEVAVRFEDHAKAYKFKQYLKTSAGRSYARKHFWSSAENKVRFIREAA